MHVVAFRGVVRSAFVMLGVLVATASCRREEKKVPAPAPRPELPPLVATAAAAPLPVPGFGDAIVSAPAGVTAPAPVLVAVLGIGDTPESQCATWRELVGQRAFVLCPRGLPHYVPLEASPVEGSDSATATTATTATAAGDPSAESAASGQSGPSGQSGESGETTSNEPQPDSGKVVQAGFYPSDVASVEREVAAGLAALRARYGSHVAAGAVVYTGFSRGAFLGASVAANSPATFTRAVLIEGGQSPWTDETAAAFAKKGGKRILFACGRPSCVTEAEQAAAILAKQRVETRIVMGDGEGHGYKKQVKDQLRASFDWVTEGDPSWRQLIAASGRAPAPGGTGRP